jgi:ABC transporter
MALISPSRTDPSPYSSAPSGSGKPTLLRMIAGLEELTSGEVHIGGVRSDHLLPSARRMAMVFQSYALYPHMSVYENLRFGLVNQKMPKAEIDARIRRAADILRSRGQSSPPKCSVPRRSYSPVCSRAKLSLPQFGEFEAFSRAPRFDSLSTADLCTCSTSEA